VTANQWCGKVGYLKNKSLFGPGYAREYSSLVVVLFPLSSDLPRHVFGWGGLRKAFGVNQHPDTPLSYVLLEKGMQLVSKGIIARL